MKKILIILILCSSSYCFSQVAPVANDDIVTTPLIEDGASGVVSILTNDTDADGSPTPTSGHTVDLGPTPGIQNTITTLEGVWTYDTTTGVVTFDPAVNFNGVAVLPYTLCDTGTPVLCDDATITFTVNPVNDAPILINNTITTNVNTPVSGDLTVNGIDYDIDGTPLVAYTAPLSGPMVGALIVISPDGSYTYIPAPGFVGTDVVTAQVCDCGLPSPILCGTKTLTVQVINATSGVPIANDDSASIPFNSVGTEGTISILLNDFDIDGNPSPTSGHTIDLDLTTAGVQNTITTSAGTWVYDGSTGTVALNFNIGFYGVAMLTYQLCDSIGFCDTAEIVFAVQQSSSLIFLNAFLDNNANGILDSGEPNFYQGNFQYELNDDGFMHYLSSNSIGVINDSVTTNSYDFSFVINSNFASQYSCSTSYTNVSPSNSGTQIFNFPVTSSTANFEDVEVMVLPEWSSPRPGFYYHNYAVLRNNGNQTIASGTLTFTKDPAVIISSVSPAASTITGTGFTYNFSNLLPFETRYISVTMLVPTIATVAIGQQLTNSVTVGALPDETFTTNNSSSITQTIVGAYDPNDKTELHGGPIVHSTFTNEDYLTYTIRFENTGTANAEFVKVEDTLDPKLDENSIEMIDSDHTYTLERTGNAMVWKFYDINLPPSVPDSSIGHGYITFRIKPKPGYAIGDIIENTAQIYFDTNPAIVTNTYHTEFVTTLRIDDFSSNDLKVYPNPVEDIVQLSFNNGDEKKIEIFNCLGVLLTTKTVSSDFMSFDFSGYTSGVYFVKCSMDNALIQTVKVVKK